MFTGIVEEVGRLLQWRRTARGYEMRLYSERLLDGTKLGDSIAVNGTCLTVTELGDDEFSVGVSPETRARTNLMHLKPGADVNLERAVTPNTRMGGHFVQGHVDGVGKIVSVRQDQETVWFKINAAADLMKYIVPKGFIALDGTSLTVVDVQETHFSVMLVPFTQDHIILPQKKSGYQINIEVDVLGKYVEKLLAYQLQGKPVKAESNISSAFLSEHGFDS